MKKGLRLIVERTEEKSDSLVGDLRGLGGDEILKHVEPMPILICQSVHELNHIAEKYKLAVESHDDLEILSVQGDHSQFKQHTITLFVTAAEILAKNKNCKLQLSFR